MIRLPVNCCDAITTSATSDRECMYDIVEFAEWEASVSEAIKADPLWHMRVYRLSLFVGTRVMVDAHALSRATGGAPIADQLTRAVASIGANIAEGYSRDSGRDRARIFGYALGSARESLHWYRASERCLPGERVAPQMAALDQIRRLLLAIIPKERTRQLK